MSTKSTPEITDYEGEDYTCVTFYPDFSRFKLKESDEDMINLMKKRVYDIAGTTSQNVKVFLNGKQVPVSNFMEYVKMYLVSSSDDNQNKLPLISYENPNNRWQVVVSLSDSQFTQISFVNTICTMKGGTHVDSIVIKVI